MAADLVGIVIVSSTIALTFNRVLFFGDSLWYWDIAFLNVPFRRALGFALKTGNVEALIWNPLIYGGFPLLAEAQGGFLYLPNLIGYYWLNAVDANTALTVSHYALASVSSYVLARRFGASRTGAVVAGATYALGGAFAGSILYTPIISAAAWLPLLLLSFDWAIQSPRTVRALPAGVIFGIQILAGHYQIAAFSFASLAIFGFGVLLVDSEPVTTALRMLRTLVVVAAAGLGLSAVQILPTLQLLSETFRSTVPFDFAMSGSIPPSSLVTLVYPLAWFDPVSGQSIDQYGADVWLYTGVAPLFLAGVAVIGSDRKRTLPLLILTLLSLTLAMGRYLPIYPVVYHLPVFNGFRFPSRFAFTFDLGIGILAALGLTRLGEMRPNRTALSLLGVGAFGLAFLLFAYFQEIRGRLSIIPPDNVRKAVVDNVGYPRAAQSVIQQLLLSTVDWHRPWVASSIIFLVLTGTLLALAGRLRCVAGGLRASFALVALLDLMFFASFVWPVARAPRYLAVDTPSIVKAIPRATPNERVATGYGLAPVEDLLRPNVLLNVGIPTIEGFGSFIPRRHAIFLQLLSKEAGKPRLAELLGAAGVPVAIYAPATHDPQSRSPFAFTLMTSGAPPSPFAGANFTSIWQSGDAQIYRDTLALPRAYTVNQVKAVQSLDDAAALLARTDIDPTRVAVVEGPVVLPPGTPAGAHSEIQWIRDDPLDLQLVVTADHPVYLVLADLWYPAWQAEVDGALTTIFPTDVMFRGVVVPAGRHFVQFSYGLETILVGGAVSVATIVGIAIWTVVATRKQRRKNM